MPDKVMNITFASNLSNLTERNSSFDSAVLRIAYTGKNRNKTSISKEAFEDAIPSMYNCPIVCNYSREEDKIGGHDTELAEDDNGELHFVNVTQPVGVIPESAETWFETVTEKDGKEHEYLCANVVLWKRQEAYRKIKEDGIAAQSMEINIKDGKKVNGIYDIRKFEFNAFCLLGDCEPCFESASLTMFSLSDFKAQFALMMQEFKETIAEEDCPKGGEELEDTNVVEIETVEEQNPEVVEEQNTEEYAAEETVVSDESTEEVDAVVEESVEENDTHEEEQPQENFELARGFEESLRDAVDEAKVSGEYGEYRRYWAEDYDADAMLVYCRDTTDWKMYSFAYTRDGDTVKIDWESKKRVKVAYVEFVEGGMDVGVPPVFQMMEDKYAAISAECEELRAFKAGVEAEKEAAAKDEVFSKFEDLNDIEEFTALVADCSAYSVSELEEKCFALRGRYGTAQANFSLAEKANKIIIDRSVEAQEYEPYGGLVKKYINK